MTELRDAVFYCALLPGLLIACDQPQSDLSTASRNQGLSPKSNTGSTIKSTSPTGSSKMVRRPDNMGDLVLTPERRRRIESRFSNTKGFIDANDLEQRLFELELLRGKEKEAIEKFDLWAKGKWVLFTGNIAEPGAASFQLAVRYTPRDSDDPMGLTSNWFFVRFTDVDLYRADEYRPGEPAAVVARYNGKAKAGPGYDLILSGEWLQPLSEQ